MPRYYHTVLATALMTALSLPALAQTLTPTNDTAPAAADQMAGPDAAPAKPMTANHLHHRIVKHRAHVAAKEAAKTAAVPPAPSK